MQRLEVSGAVRLVYKSLGFKGLTAALSKLILWYKMWEVKKMYTALCIGGISTWPFPCVEHKA